MIPSIKSITEAFSQQPVCKYVTTQDSLDKRKISPCKTDIKEIRLETVEIGRKYGDPIQDLYYVGYNFEGTRLFQYLALTVNVDFQVL